MIQTVVVVETAEVESAAGSAVEEARRQRLGIPLFQE